MGSIAELLGYTLDLEHPETTQESEASFGEKDNAANQDAHDRQEIAMAAVLAETALEPEEARADLTLRGDLDMDDLVLYAIIARIEHDLLVRFTDADIASWRTLGDLLDAVGAVTAS